jgi:hypothetical protein
MDEQMRETKPIKPRAAISPPDQPASIWIVVRPERRGRYTAWVHGEQTPLCVSRQPFLDSARKLIAQGHDPRATLLMRHDGQVDWALRGRLGLAAELTVDEHNGTVFAKWKPFAQSAGSASVAPRSVRLPDAEIPIPRRRKTPPSERRDLITSAGRAHARG